jgi:hypothetical protein
MWMTKTIRPHRANKFPKKRRHPTPVFTYASEQADERDVPTFLNRKPGKEFLHRIRGL